MPSSKHCRRAHLARLPTRRCDRRRKAPRRRGRTRGRCAEDRSLAQHQSSADPAAAFRELVSQWEKGINEFASRTMNSDEFSQAMNKATTASTSMQQQLAELIGRYLMPPTLPSRSEMMNIAERLQAIETS